MLHKFHWGLQMHLSVDGLIRVSSKANRALNGQMSAKPSLCLCDHVSPPLLIVSSHAHLGALSVLIMVFCSKFEKRNDRFHFANNMPSTYSASVGFQIMGPQLARLPRWIYSCVGVVIYAACALGGRNHLYDIFDDWLSLMGYWVTICLTIAVEERDSTGVRGPIRPDCRSTS